MAGYRPKSLNELNDMYDKTITAEKAIIKASQQLHDVTETIVPSESVQPAVEKQQKEETRAVEELSSEVDSLINRFKSEMTAPAVKAAEPPAPKMAATATEPPKTISFEKDKKPAEESAKAPAPSIPAEPAVKAKTHYELELPGEVIQKAASKSDERTGLFDDYMKIMNDDDDDFFSKHESFKKKGKKKKYKKSLFSRHEPKEEVVEDTTDAAEEPAVEVPAAEVQEDALPIREVIYSPEVPDEDSGLKIEFSAFSQSSPTDSDKEEEFADFAQQDYTEAEEEIPEASREAADAENEESSEEYLDFDIGEVKDDELPPVPAELADTTYDEFMNSDDIYSFDPNKANTIPGYAKDSYSPEEDETVYAENGEEEYYDEEDSACSEEEYPVPKNKKGIVAGRVILSIVLSLLVLVAVAVSGINLVLGVNSGREVFGNKFIFTAESDYTGADILDGDLVITENRYAEDGEVFAYINYTQQKFMFGKRNGSIVNDISDVLFIAENNGERVLVLRDDTRGVVTNIYPGVGKIVSVCTDYFIPVIAVILILGLVIVLLLAFVFKDKEKAYKKMMKKMIKKGVITADEESDYSYTEESGTENLFSSIE